MSEEVVLFEEVNCLTDKKIAVATLNSPRSLNALSGDMIDLLMPKLLEWRDNDDIVMIFLQGSGDKAFCAGGDIVHMYNAMTESAMKENTTTANSEAKDKSVPALEQYFTKEYQLDYLIHTFNKPFLVWGQGIVMGGGLGLMVGASHRVVTESSRIAMPEISIGLYPDVGGSYFLNRMPENCGLFLGLTGASINAADAKYTQMADFFLLNEHKQKLLTALSEVKWGDTIALNHDKLSDVLQSFEQDVKASLPNSHLKQHQSLINQVIQQPDLVAIVDAIISVDIEDKWFNKAQKSLAHGSPMSAHLVYQQLQQAQSMTLAECFKLELGLSVKSGQFGEFCEGVRALLIDKDNQPNWHFSNVEEVDAKTLAWFFETPWQAESHPLAELEQV